MIKAIFEKLFEPNSEDEVEKRAGGPFFVSWGGDTKEGEETASTKDEAIEIAVRAFGKNAGSDYFYFVTVMQGSPDPDEGVLVFMCQATDLEEAGWNDAAPGISAYKHVGKRK